MKALVLFLMISLSGFAQDTNFMLKDNSLIWENVFITNDTNIPVLLAKHPRLQIDSSAGNVYKGKGTHVKNTCTGTSEFIDREFNFNFEIEVSDGKYSVTIYNITFAEGKSKMKKPVGAETFLLDKGKIKKDAQAATNYSCLDGFFNRTFTMGTSLKNKL